MPSARPSRSAYGRRGPSDCSRDLSTELGKDGFILNATLSLRGFYALCTLSAFNARLSLLVSSCCPGTVAAYLERQFRQTEEFDAASVLRFEGASFRRYSPKIWNSLGCGTVLLGPPNLAGEDW